MPIKEWSDKFRLPVLGTIHLGEPKPERGQQHPKSIDYFRFPEGIAHPFGERPKEIEIAFPCDDQEWCCSAWFKQWGGSKDPKKATLLCCGNGKTAIRKNMQTGEDEQVQCLGRGCERYIDGACCEQIWLRFMLPTVLGLGAWQIYSKSYNSYVNINSILTMFTNAQRRFAGLRFKMRVRMESKIMPIDGKAVRVNYPVLYIIQDDISFAELTTGTGRLALPSRESLPDAPAERPDDLVPKRHRSGDNGDPEPESEPIDTEAVEVAEEETKAKAEVAEKKVKVATARPAKRTSLF